MHGLMQRHSTIYIVAAILSIAISFWVSLKGVVVNPDAICYLQSAETMKQGLMTAMHLCDQAKWPLYSALIYVVKNITNLSTVYSAYLLNGFFSLISVLTFIGIFQFFKASTRLLWIAAFVILLAPQFNSVKVYIVRDHGFWAFYLVSILLALNYFQKPRWHLAIAWNFAIIVATLFRIEGLLFLLLVPFIAWVDFSQKLISRLKSFLQLNTCILVVFAVLAICFWYHSKQIMDNLGRVDEVEFQILHGFEMVTNHFKSNAAALAQHVLSPYSAGDASLILFLMLVIWYVVAVAYNISFIYAVLVVYAWSKRLLKVDGRSRLVLWSYVILNVVITAIFLVENMFLAKRYLMALSLVLMVWVPFAINELIEIRQKNKWSLVFTIFFIFVFALAGLFEFGPSKTYIKNAGQWLQQNAPENAVIYSNDYQVMYYSQHFGNTIFDKAPLYASTDIFASDKWKQYDYIALRSKKAEIEKNENKMNATGLVAVQTFKNKRGDQVSIYKVVH